jgi:4-hydroxy-tetrahydrodipicolinate reductase
MTIRVGVFGAAGRMGSTVCRAVAADADLELVAAMDPHHAGLDIKQVAGVDSDIHVDADSHAFLDAGVEVVVDFTLLDAARENLAWAAEHGVHAVVGTTGFTDDDYAQLEASFTRSNCIIAPNFSIGAVLMMRFAEIAAPWFDTGEILELHHDQKIDAPSGTAMMTARRMTAASDQWVVDPTQKETLPGARGGRVGGVNVHAMRMRGMFAHQEVVLGTDGQTLSIRHDTFDRTCYMPGVLLAVKEIAKRPGVTIGLDDLLGL